MSDRKTLVQIRFNTTYKPDDGSKEWRVLVDGFENFCNRVVIHCQSETSKDFIEGVGDKWHISCAPTRIEYVKDDIVEDLPAHFFREIILY